MILLTLGKDWYRKASLDNRSSVGSLCFIKRVKDLLFQKSGGFVNKHEFWNILLFSEIGDIEQDVLIGFNVVKFDLLEVANKDL
jgi:hypothetical protein